MSVYLYDTDVPTVVVEVAKYAKNNPPVPVEAVVIPTCVSDHAVDVFGPNVFSAAVDW